MFETSNGSGIFASTAREPKIRVGVIGLGRSGTFFHCRPISESSKYELVAVQDARPVVAERVAGQYGCEAFQTHEELIASPDVDLVVVAVPTSAHHDLALDAIAARKHVLVEKPFARTPVEAGRMFDAGERAGVFVGAYHNRRFDPDVIVLGRLLKSGVLGQVLKVSIHLHSYVRRNDWQTLRSMGGGALSNWGAHALDWCFYLFGPELTLSQARLFQALNPGDAEDSFLLFVESDQTLIEIEYLNCAAKELPRWHVVGRYGTAVSQGQSFSVRYCDPSRLCPLEADEGMASDGRYGITEDLSWTEETLPLGHWDNCPPFFNQLYEHLIHGAPPPITSHDVLAQLKLMERVRMTPLRKLDPHSLETIRSAGRLSLIANGSLG